MLLNCRDFLIVINDKSNIDLLEERKRISDEIALLKQLKHPNIIHFISAWINRQKEEVIFITEAVTGGSLKRFSLHI
jgi:serine/threonine protein kinase